MNNTFFKYIVCIIRFKYFHSNYIVVGTEFEDENL